MYSINEAGIPTFMLPREKKTSMLKDYFTPKFCNCHLLTFKLLRPCMSYFLEWNIRKRILAEYLNFSLSYNEYGWNQGLPKGPKTL